MLDCMRFSRPSEERLFFAMIIISDRCVLIDVRVYMMYLHTLIYTLYSVVAKVQARISVCRYMYTVQKLLTTSVTCLKKSVLLAAVNGKHV